MVSLDAQRKAADPSFSAEEMKRDMLDAAERLEFERAAYLRDRIAELVSDRR